MKTKTLEEVDKYIHSLAFDEALIQNKLNGISILDLIPMFIKGYKAAQSKTYTEEDILNAIRFVTNNYSINAWQNRPIGGKDLESEDSFTIKNKFIQSLQPK